MCGVGDELSVDGVGDLSFERAECFFAAVAFGDLASVVDASGGVVAGLGDRGDVQCVVQLAVPVGVQSVPVVGCRRCRDRCGGVVAGVVTGGREAADVAGVAEDVGGHDRADTVHVGDRGARRL